MCMCLKMGSCPSWVHLKRQEVMTIRWVLGYPVFWQTQSTCLIWADDGGSNLCIEERNYTQSNTKLNSHTTMMNDCFYWLVDFSNSWAISIWKKLAGQKRCFLWTIMTCTFETWNTCPWNYMAKMWLTYLLYTWQFKVTILGLVSDHFKG